MLQLTICLDSGGEKPLYQQLYESLAAQIRSGVLKAGDRLPGKRALAGQLAVAVNTVDTAYQMLAAEGYLAVSYTHLSLPSPPVPLHPHLLSVRRGGH